MRAAGSLRRHAFERLATLSASQDAQQSSGPGLPQLCSLYPPASDGGLRSASKSPMGIREFEVLLALCHAAPHVTHLQHAEQLLRQIAPYLSEAHAQTFRSSPTLKDIQPSPWEVLVRDVTAAVLAISTNHPILQPLATTHIKHTVDGFVATADDIASSNARNESDGRDPEAADAPRSITFCLTLLGFLTAFSERAEACTAQDRLTFLGQLQKILSSSFMIAIEGTLSSIRNSRGQLREWKRLLRSYALSGRPLGAMILQHGAMHYIASCAALLVVPPAHGQHMDVLDFLVKHKLPLAHISEDYGVDALETLTNLTAESISLLEADADFLQVSSASQQRLAFSAKANSLTSFLCLSLVNEDIADADILMAWAEAVLADQGQLIDDELAQTALKCMAVLAKTSNTLASSLARSLPRVIVQGNMTSGTALVAADCLAGVLMHLSQDIVISTLYSLGNVLSTRAGRSRASTSLFADGDVGSKTSTHLYSQHHATGSAVSLATSDTDETALVQGCIVKAIVQIASRCNDEQITALAMSMLVQKMDRANTAVEVQIIRGSAALGLFCGPNELRPLLKLYARVAHDAISQQNLALIQAVMDARVQLAEGITKDSSLYETYLTHLLDAIVSMSDGHDHNAENGLSTHATIGAEEIAQLLRPFSILVAGSPASSDDVEDPEAVSDLSRNAWFNLVAHGFTINSALAKRHSDELRTLAWYSPSLINKNRAESQESGIELNTVLRRSSNPMHASQQRASLTSALPNCEADIKSLDFAELTFLNAANLVAILRARAGDCTRTMEYFFDHRFKSGPLGNCLFAIAMSAVDVYLGRTHTGLYQRFAAPELAQQLVIFFQGACHRIAKVQHVAVSAADRIISQVPSALCQRSSLFAMLELLSLMWTSCLEAETDEYEGKSSYHSEKGNVSIQLSDDFSFRRSTLNSFQKRCRAWVSRVMDVAPLDMKGLLQTYLSDYDDDGAYGHVSLGRSFAVEMGSLIPGSDQRLGAIDRQRELSLNSASDFIAQYTTRQEYRTMDNLSSLDEEVTYTRRQVTEVTVQQDLTMQAKLAATNLKDMQRRVEAREVVLLSEIMPALRIAAGLLCRLNFDAAGLAHYLVAIPFSLFSKQSIKLGISLWMGVLRENSKLGPRILAEMASHWEMSVQKRRGIFSRSLLHLDPFYVKEEFAPSSRDALVKRQQHVHDIIAPHFRLVQCLSSHFNASRLCSPFLDRVFFRLMRVTLAAMRHGASQPLAREVHFHIILLGLRILIHGTGADGKAEWELKDQILSAGLEWFRLPPRWSYGGNRLQIKAELQLMADVTSALGKVVGVGQSPTKSLQSLQHKQELLIILLQSESTRLAVWLTPLGHDSSSSHMLGFGGSSTKAATEAMVSPLLKVAWAESASLAVQLAVRFQSLRLNNEVRALLLHNPEKALDEPDALHIMLGSSLPQDVSFQLKYLLYWAAVNPITAVTYFLPAYGNHPFIVQYAMRALESHSVDVTFFYVPQIVQTLRYDALGYVQRYIIETAKFSQLFAHQIIWNIKANAYKDEDSQIPDPVKPTLDIVMDALIDSFSATDKDFYEREFGFFNEVTSISGKLRPFIKRPKPEKKAKIEEELRKIQVDVGVYLPSNPDGVIIGIDRKSGKPLQSHAKAPFMATFRIRKELGGDMEAVDEEVDRAAEGKELKKENTYEAWQSAIFKVGDDCRQDVLALQMIAAFRGIFNNVGLDVYVFPYRVTATAPGCGVIDVLPNSISRDMLGREAVNGLYEYFVSKYGSEDSLRFQAARANFVKSMAAYSVISYLLQFKDRHNGNIMVDDAGHILHIDFGFCFDIAPGGVKFERAPFKLTSEMVAVMGGSTEAQPYRWFEELCVKAFLASRQHADKLSHLVVVMLDSGLPCFKPVTVQHLRERFVLDKTEREAAEFMRMLIRRSYSSYSTGVYDGFQLLTNGIPY